MASAVAQGAVAKASAKVAGKTVLITGGSQGSGRSTALLFAKKGYNVVVTARQPDRLKLVADECVRLSQRPALAVAADVGRQQDVEALVQQVLEQYEQVDVLVNNAGICSTGSVRDTPPEEVLRLAETNYLGPAYLTHALLPHLLERAKAAAVQQQPGPSIVMVNSFAARIPLKNMAAYTGSKYALAGYTDALRAELAPAGVHVAQVHPGVIRSNFLERATWFGPAGEEARVTMKSMWEGAGGLLQTPEQIAEEVYGAVVNRRKEVMVGGAFGALEALYRFTGLNPMSMR